MSKALDSDVRKSIALNTTLGSGVSIVQTYTQGEAASLQIVPHNEEARAFLARSTPEALREEYGEDIARIVDKRKYRWNPIGYGIAWQPGAEGLSKKRMINSFPIGKRAVGEEVLLCLGRETYAPWYLFGAERPHRRYAEAYDRLRLHYAEGGSVGENLLQGLILKRDALERQIAREEQRIRNLLRETRLVLAAWYAETLNCVFEEAESKEEADERLLGIIWGVRMLWRLIATGVARDEVETAFSGFMRSDDLSFKPFRQVQQQALLRFVGERAAVVDERALPLEYERVACEMILDRALLRQPIEPWGTAHETALSPAVLRTPEDDELRTILIGWNNDAYKSAFAAYLEDTYQRLKSRKKMEQQYHADCDRLLVPLLGRCRAPDRFVQGTGRDRVFSDAD